MKSQIKGRVFWVGSTGWNDHLPGEGLVAHFHKSASYNSYLIFGNHNFLIDTVAKDFAKDYVQNLSREIPINDLYGIILSCDKSDHIGAVPDILKINPNINVYASESDIKVIRKALGSGARIIPIHNGDCLHEPDISFDFIEVTPFKGHRSLFCYIREEKVLFSGYATEYMLQDLLGTENPFRNNTNEESQPVSSILRRKLTEKMHTNIAPDVVCTNHGTPMYMF